MIPNIQRSIAQMQADVSSRWLCLSIDWLFAIRRGQTTTTTTSVDAIQPFAKRQATVERGNYFVLNCVSIFRVITSFSNVDHKSLNCVFFFQSSNFLSFSNSNFTEPMHRQARWHHATDTQQSTQRSSQ